MEKKYRTVRIKVYKFDALTDEAKENAFRKYRDYSLEGEWWDSLYEDAKNVGLKITSSDKDNYCKGEFFASAEETAHKIVENHGEGCETLKTAKAYLQERDKIVDTWTKDADGNFENEGDLEDELDELDEEFLRSLLEDYRIMLSHEYDCLSGEENLKEVFADWEFLEDGTRY